MNDFKEEPRNLVVLVFIGYLNMRWELDVGKPNLVLDGFYSTAKPCTIYDINIRDYSVLRSH